MTEVTTNGECVLGIDLGATKMALASVDPLGRILSRGVAPSPSEDGTRMVESLLELAAAGVASSREDGLEVKAVGIGAAGFILEREGLLISSPNIAWSMVPLRNLVAERVGLPTFLDNDANAAAVGEHFVGVARGVDDFVYLTLGTGIGGGIFAGGLIYRGHRGTAAEIGHMTVDPAGPECGCGRRGCLEALASGTALEREAVRLAAGDSRSLLHEMSTSEPGRVTGEMISAAAESGDAAARGAFENITYYLGLGIVNLVHLLDPEMVVLGGGVARSPHLIPEEVRSVVVERGVPTLVSDVSIAVSALGGDAGVIGAAAMAWEGTGGSPSN